MEGNSSKVKWCPPNDEQFDLGETEVVITLKICRPYSSSMSFMQILHDRKLCFYNNNTDKFLDMSKITGQNFLNL